MPIARVAVFAGDTLSQSPVSNRVLGTGGRVVINPPESLMALADEDLDLHGELRAFDGDRALEYVGYKTDLDWREFIRSRFPGQPVQVARRVTDNFEYVVVVVFAE